jgi:membrane protease YdiL (CAAX protease family)
VPYTAIADSESNLRRGVMVPVGLGLAVLLVYAVATGTLADAFTYAPTVSVTWLWAVPALILAGIVVRLASTDWRSLGGRRIVVIAVTSLLIGASEELLVRGLFLDTAQDAGLAAVWVAVVTSIVFGLLHGMNVLLGQDAVTTMLQVVTTTLMGLALFTSLALSGSLWLPILLHALFDFSLLAQGSVVKRSARPIEVALTLLPNVLAIGVLFAL